MEYPEHFPICEKQNYCLQLLPHLFLRQKLNARVSFENHLLLCHSQAAGKNSCRSFVCHITRLIRVIMADFCSHKEKDYCFFGVFYVHTPFDAKNVKLRSKRYKKICCKNNTLLQQIYKSFIQPLFRENLRFPEKTSSEKLRQHLARRASRASS